MHNVSSLHRQKNQPYWFCAYRGPDGQQHFKSTGTKGKAVAKIIARRLEEAARAAWKRQLSPERARNIIESALTELCAETGQALPRCTVRTVILPIARPLLRHIEKLPAGDDPKAALCPNLKGRNSGWLSGQFYNLMVAAGLVAARDHQGKGTGREKRRQWSEISFHALRHTATSLLKNAGVSDVIARDIIGHESAAISRHYTHIETETKRQAVNKLPDVLN